MIAEYFCKGLLIGFIFGVPAGAIAALTIGRTLDAAAWEDNESVSALTELLCEQSLSIQMSMYGDFENPLKNWKNCWAAGM